MTLIVFGFDKDPDIYARGIARSDWKLEARLDSRGYGWQINDLHGGRSRHMSLDAAVEILRS